MTRIKHPLFENSFIAVDYPRHIPLEVISVTRRYSWIDSIL
jgi:hypothetical protein